MPETLPDDFVTLENESLVTRLQLPGVNFTMLQFNLTQPFFQDVRVRQAINHAIDRSSIIAAVGGGFGIPVTQIVHPSLPEYNPNLEGFAFDPDGARALLAEAGWTDDNGDGIVEARNLQRELFGDKRLAAHLAGWTGERELTETLCEAVSAFTGPGREQEDDITMFVIERAAEEGCLPPRRGLSSDH